MRGAARPDWDWAGFLFVQMLFGLLAASLASGAEQALGAGHIQWSPGVVAALLYAVSYTHLDLYGTQEKCEAAVIGWRWPKGYVCPSCGMAGASFSSFRRGRLLYRQCSGCHFQCSVIAGTAFEATKLPLTVWFLAMHLLTQACLLYTSRCV